ncbi:AraC family transcriptional regulator [Paenibacillus darwinianus]|uniref:AraC family transcriptional regulator n=1 Tax=Paenibacillus darwinianus TaxID=1380763 RepID=A0A9W5RZW3_9BACL|nr:response regulator [Paenibacillus darwinianus]EXX86764.1 AraC family transcriptional regulator [Paenibacillus darwinianus]EXX87076.1 AraC family transcriptional regulator [Paenibacillus darwinianus]EXX87286.1 AraC family transcriptional regulator [Paenibacillus darwinianus]
MHILVVDDERAIREGIKRTIGSAFPRIGVTTAASADEATRVLVNEPIHAVFLDIMMPGMSGLELLAQVRTTHSNMKWLVVSAHSEFAFAQEAMRLGARDYFLKPFGKDQIVKAVTALEAEWDEEQRQMSGQALLQMNLNYLREAVFRRWIQGLDLGCFDLTAIREEHERFHLLTVRLESSRELTLRNFIAENVMSEYIAMNGRGFIVSVEGDFLAGVVTLAEGVTPESFQAGAAGQLDSCLKVPYRFHMSGLLTDFYAIPQEIGKLHAGGTGGLAAVGASDAAVPIAAGYAAASASSAADAKNDVIDIALQYIKGSFRNNLSLELVASVVFLNPVYFSKLFKQKTGWGYKEYVTQLRMERAAELLAATELTVTRIGEEVGYPDVRHFTQVFRKYYDMTPSRYRADRAIN